MARYKIQLAKNFENPTRWRAGRMFERNVPQVLELTKEEVEAFKDDRYFTITKTTSKAESTDGAEGNDTPQSADADTKTTDEESTESSEGSDSGEDQGSEGENEAPQAGEERKVKLLQKSRKAVNSIAKKLGIENADQMANKEVVADAIIEAEAVN